MLSWLKHIVVYTLENRSFNHVLESLDEVADRDPHVRLAGPGGHEVAPFPIRWSSSAQCANPNHSWDKIHESWNHGAMNGFVEANGPDVMGYWPPVRIANFIRAAHQGLILDHYFSSVLGPTLPNRLYQIAGTSGGLKNDPPLFGSETFHMPTVFDQLTDKRIPWRYYIGDYGSCEILPKQMLFCPLLWFPRFERPPLNRHLVDLHRFFDDIQKQRLPAVSFLAPRLATSGHPPFPVPWALDSALRVYSALRSSPLWKSSLFILTFDESGGFYDPVPPPQMDAYGLGIRVPTVLWSAGITPGISHDVFDHTSILRLIEELHGLPLLGERTAQMASLASVLV